MSLLNWFKKASPQSPQLEALVAKVALYLTGRPSDDQIVPKIVARAIGESEIRSFTALRMLEAQGVVDQQFGVYCGRTAIPLKVITDLSQVPDELYCFTCDKDHSGSDQGLDVEIYYTINPTKLAQFAQRRAA